MSISLAGVESVKCTCMAISATIDVGTATASRTVFDKLSDDASDDVTSLDAVVVAARTVLAAIGPAAMVVVVDDDGYNCVGSRWLRIGFILIWQQSIGGKGR